MNNPDEFTATFDVGNRQRDRVAQLAIHHTDQDAAGMARRYQPARAHARNRRLAAAPFQLRWGITPWTMEADRHQLQRVTNVQSGALRVDDEIRVR